MNKILSVIIPTYNMEELLDRCLSSLILESAEKRQLLDVIVVNDGSKDKSSEIAHKYAGNYPEMFSVIDKENGNYGSCINAALPHVKGKYVRILDADDSYITSNFDEYIRILDTIDVDLVLTDFLDCLPDGNSQNHHSFSFRPNVIFPFETIRYDTFISMHSVTYKTELFHKINYYQSEKVSYTDMEWVFHPMSVVNTVYYCQLCIYKYFMGRKGQTVDYDVILKRQGDAAKGIFREIEVIKCVSKDNKAYMYMDYWLKFRIESIYRDNLLTRNRHYNLAEFDNHLKKYSSYYYDYATSIQFEIKHFGKEIPLVELWRKCGSSSLFYFHWYYILYKICSKI